MSPALAHAAVAAQRLLQRWAEHGHDRLSEMELAAWVLARQGLPLPAHAATRQQQLHLQAAACLARRDEAAAAELLDRSLREPDGALLLMHACHLAGPCMPDVLLKLAEGHRGLAFNGQLLATTSQPERLWALVADDRALGHRVITLGELLLRGRDQGKPLPFAEAQWAALAADPWSHAHEGRYRDIWLRVAARESLPAAAERLQEWAAGFGCGEIYDGAAAVLARLVRSDTQRAVAAVAERADAADRAQWLQMLTWWFELPPAAERLLPPLLASGATQARGFWPALVHALARARAPQWLDQALQQTADVPATALARAAAAAACQLADAGLHADAERLRQQMMPRLSSEPFAGDLFDLLSAPDQPAWVPWGTGPGLP